MNDYVGDLVRVSLRQGHNANTTVSVEMLGAFMDALRNDDKLAYQVMGMMLSSLSNAMQEFMPAITTIQDREEEIRQ